MNVAELSTKLETSRVHIAEMGHAVKNLVCQQKWEMENIKQHNNEGAEFWKEFSWKNADILINDVKVTKVDSAKMYVDRNFILTRFNEHLLLPQTVVDANVERMVTLSESTTDIRELHENGCSINRLDYSAEIAKFTHEVQRLSGLVESKNSKLRG